MPIPVPQNSSTFDSESNLTNGRSGTGSMPAGPGSLIAELEAATNEASQQRRVQMLRRVTDLFVGNAGVLGEDQADIFGDVIGHLIQRVEKEALVDLGSRLAPLENAPNTIIQSLARHDEIAVAGPVLARSIKLTDDDLIEIARSKGQDHLGAISERNRIAAAVTDILVERGSASVVRKLSRNQGADFSDSGFQQLTDRAVEDEHLAQNLAQRVDLPASLLERLVSEATDAVRARMLAAAPPDRRNAIEAALASASSRVLRNATVQRDFDSAQARIAAMTKNGSFNEAAMMQFANGKQYEDMVAGLAKLCSAPIKLIDQLMSQARHDGIIVLCKAASIRWPVCSAILMNRFPKHEMSAGELERARSDYLRLSPATAQRALRFWLIRGVARTQTETGE